MAKTNKKKAKKKNLKPWIVALVTLIVALLTGAGVNISIENGKVKSDIVYSDEEQPAEIMDGISDVEYGQGEVKVDGEEIPTVESVDASGQQVNPEDETPEECPEGEECGRGAAYPYVDTSTPQAFINATLGGCYDVDGHYNEQCWDYAALFTLNYAGRTFYTCGTGAAKGAFADGCWQKNAGTEFIFTTDPRDIIPGAIVGFNNEVFRFESCFNPVVEHCVIITDGKIVLTTYDGTVTETNFTNCACFVNVYISKYSENRISVVFDMTNARYTTFHKCQLENAELLVSAKNKTNGVDFYSCWFENLTSIYRKDSTSKAPSACDCNYVRVDSYNADENTIDYISGRGLLLQKSTGNSGLKTALNNSVVLEEANIYNKGDGFSDYTPIYRITTTETDFNQPLNKRTIYKTSVNSAEFNLQSILRYSGADCVFNVVARILYSDDSSKIIETKVRIAARI